MCCSMRATIFFLSSNHIYFSISQMIKIIPTVVDIFNDKIFMCIMTFVFGVFFLVTGFISFRGADQESSTLIRCGAFSLILVLLFRFILMGLSLMISDILPEATFLYVYRTAIIPVMFTLLIYLFYLAMLFCYHNELTEEKMMAILGSSTSHNSNSHGRRFNGFGGGGGGNRRNRRATAGINQNQHQFRLHQFSVSSAAVHDSGAGFHGSIIP